jgi:hypothetical protein
MNPGQAVTVHKLDARGAEVWTYTGRVLLATSTSVTLEASYNGPEEDFHGLPLRHGDRFIETFYSDRGYNVFAIHDPEGMRLKGWYCNITRPAVFGDGHIQAEDLALDLIVLPDGQSVIVDEDEFRSLELGDDEREAAWATLERLREWALRRSGPFAYVPPHK